MKPRELDLVGKNERRMCMPFDSLKRVANKDTVFSACSGAVVKGELFELVRKVHGW